jgi:hypothetical protein
MCGVVMFMLKIYIRAITANPSINTDWRDKAAPAGYVKR